MLNVATVVGSAYDSVSLPEDLFEPGALRVKLNFPEGWNFYEGTVHPDF